MEQRVYESAHGKADPLNRGALEIAHLIGRIANVVLDFDESIRVEVYAALRRELHERQRAHDGRVEKKHTRIAVFADDPRVHATRVDAAFPRDAVGETERFERGS